MIVVKIAMSAIVKVRQTQIVDKIATICTVKISINL